MPWQRRSRARLEIETLEDRLTPAIGYGGGAVVAHVQVQALFYGTYWSTSDGQQSASDINAYLQYLVNSPFMDVMNEYGVGRGTFWATALSIHPFGPYEDSTITCWPMHAAIACRAFDSRCTSLCAPCLRTARKPADARLSRHLSLAGGGVVNYAVIANPVGNGTDGSMNVFQTSRIQFRTSCRGGNRSRCWGCRSITGRRDRRRVDQPT